jgi:hypothetical protein
MPLFRRTRDHTKETALAFRRPGALVIATRRVFLQADASIQKN